MIINQNTLTTTTNTSLSNNLTIHWPVLGCQWIIMPNPLQDSGSEIDSDYSSEAEFNTKMLDDGIDVKPRKPCKTNVDYTSV